MKGWAGEEAEGSGLLVFGVTQIFGMEGVRIQGVIARSRAWGSKPTGFDLGIWLS